MMGIREELKSMWIEAMDEAERCKRLADKIPEYDYIISEMEREERNHADLLVHIMNEIVV